MKPCMGHFMKLPIIRLPLTPLEKQCPHANNEVNDTQNVCAHEAEISLNAKPGLPASLTCANPPPLLLLKVNWKPPSEAF